MSTRFEFTRRARPIMEVGIGSTVLDEGFGLWDVSLWDAAGSTWNGDEPLWRDFSCDVISAHVEIGRGRITDAYPVGAADVVVDNGSGWADPSIDFEADSTVGYFSLPGTAGNYVSVDDYAALAIPGDQCFVFRFRTSDWPPPYLTGQIAAQNLAWAILIEPTGALELWVVSGGSLVIMTSDPITPSTDWRWYAITLDANNGAGGHSWKVWYGGNGDDPGAWVEFDSRSAAGVLTIDNSVLPLVLGTAIADGFTGDISHFSYRSGTGPSNTVGGTPVFGFDGWNILDETATSFTPAVGPNPMIVNGSDVGVTAAVNPVSSILKLRPGRPIRVGVEHDTLGTRWLYRGFIDSIEPVDDPEDWSTVTLRCIDALGEAGRAKLTTDVETGAGEQSRIRFLRLLNLIQWPGTKRSASAAAIQAMYATELDGQVVDLLRQTAESEGGWVYGDTEGNVVLQGRDWLYHEIGDPVDATIGNLGGAFSELLLEDGGDLLLEQDDEMLTESSDMDVCPSKWVRSFDRNDIATQVTLGVDYPSTEVDPLPPIVVNDPPAQVLYGIEPFERTDLWTLSRDVLWQNAGRILATRAAAVSMPRIRSVTLAASSSDLTVDLLSQLSIFTPSRYRCRLQKDGRLVFDGNFFAVGVTHDLSADEWTADVALDLSDSFEVLDAAAYIWDTARWDHTLWN